MAIYTLDGTDKEISVQGRYASMKNNGSGVVYASSAPELDLEAPKVFRFSRGKAWWCATARYVFYSVIQL